MSTNHTPNFNLCQWEADDKVLRADFNADNQKIDAALKAAVPAGLIAAWSGAADAVPAGWALCDGANGTPDLRGRFLVGAGGDYAPGDAGGAATEELSNFSRTSGTVMGYFSAYPSDQEVHDNRPPYYALCFIMKL